MFAHRFALALVTLSLALSTVACGAHTSSSGVNDGSFHDSAWRTIPMNNSSSPPAPPVHMANESRRDRLHG